MHYIIFDLEWNQPSSASAAVMEPVYLTGEIIEIGAVKLNEDFDTDEKAEDKYRRLRASILPE